MVMVDNAEDLCEAFDLDSDLFGADTWIVGSLYVLCPSWCVVEDATRVSLLAGPH